MKNVLSLVAISVLLCVVIIGADFRASDYRPQQKKKCFGYTVIEAGKGIDCNGDTIKLIRKHGFFQFEPSASDKESV